MIQLFKNLFKKREQKHIETNLTSKRLEEIMKLETERIKPENQAAALRKRLEIKEGN